jgi:hypothetical protein
MTLFVRRPAAPVARAVALVVALVIALGVSGCDTFGSDSKDDSKPSSSGTPTPAAAAFDSQFTRDGTFQSHISLPEAPGMDFVYTLYPTKSTPRTNEWYPTGGKYFSFTFQAYDLDRDLRDPFKTKRKVWLSHVTVTSATTTSEGGATQSPYSLDADAPRTTFDPQPLTTKYGMLITSPKGAFELRNQMIGDMSADTIGVTLTLTASVSVETKAGSGKYTQASVTQQVPIAIFKSDKPTEAQSIPVDAN